MLLVRFARIFGLAHLVLGALAATILLAEPSPRRYGDELQVALPVLAWGCAVTNGNGRDFALRFFAMFAVAHGAKALLGDLQMNQRPSGGGHGFPSAHTGAAALGASNLVHDCLQGSAGAQAVVVIAAAFVGASRIEVGAHDIWQVLAGAFLGWAADRALRRESRVRRGVIAGLGWLTATARQGFFAARSRFGALLRTMPRRAAPATSITIASLAADQARAEIEPSAYGGVQAVVPRAISDANGSQYLN